MKVNGISVSEWSQQAEKVRRLFGVTDFLIAGPSSTTSDETLKALRDSQTVLVELSLVELLDRDFLETFFRFPDRTWMVTARSRNTPVDLCNHLSIQRDGTLTLLLHRQSYAQLGLTGRAIKLPHSGKRTELYQVTIDLADNKFVAGFPVYERVKQCFSLQTSAPVTLEMTFSSTERSCPFSFEFPPAWKLTKVDPVTHRGTKRVRAMNFGALAELLRAKEIPDTGYPKELILGEVEPYVASMTSEGLLAWESPALEAHALIEDSESSITIQTYSGLVDATVFEREVARIACWVSNGDVPWMCVTGWTIPAIPLASDGFVTFILLADCCLVLRGS